MTNICFNNHRQRRGKNQRNKHARLINKAAIAKALDSSVNMAITEIINAAGGARIINIPARDMSGEPQPKPDNPES